MEADIVNVPLALRETQSYLSMMFVRDATLHLLIGKGSFRKPITTLLTCVPGPWLHTVALPHPPSSRVPPCLKPLRIYFLLAHRDFLFQPLSNFPYSYASSPWLPVLPPEALISPRGYGTLNYWDSSAKASSLRSFAVSSSKKKAVHILLAATRITLYLF